MIRNKKRVLYLNRTVIWVMMIGYVSLMVLLLCMDWYLIGEYQRENREREHTVLQNYVEKIQGSMDSVDRIIQEFYMYDSDYEKLGKVHPDLVEFDTSYSLTKSLGNRMMIEENLHGYYLYYRNANKVRYGVDLVHIKSDESGQINTILKTFYNDLDKARHWNAFKTGDAVCLFNFYRKDNVALFGVHSLGNTKINLEEKLGKKLDVFYISNGLDLLEESELSSELKLRGITQDYSDLYTGRIKNHYIYGQRIENTDLWIFMAVNYNFWSIMNLPQMLLLIAALGSICAVGWLLHFMRKELVYPLRQLTTTMNHIRLGGTYEIPVQSFKFHELQEVNDTFGIMISEIEKQKLLTYEEIIERQKATMQYLQLQLKPHFYLNGLKTLNALVMEEKHDKVQELIVSLSVHMRYLLQSERETIALYQELDFVNNYVNLQKHMTGRRVECEITMDEEARTWSVPVLCAQTFVENSIKYVKLGSVNATLIITVTADLLSAENGRFLDLTVRDNGQGYDLNILEEINGDTRKGNKSVGINNIKRRCQIIYGDKAEYNFYNCQGAVSELIIPEGGKH